MKNFTPDQVREMSLAEASLAIDGFREINGGNKPGPQVTREELDEMMALYPDT